MPLTSEYEPGTSAWARKHVEQYEVTDGKKAGDLRGRPVVVLTSVGAKTGKLRKTALMSVPSRRGATTRGTRRGSPARFRSSCSNRQPVSA